MIEKSPPLPEKSKGMPRVMQRVTDVVILLASLRVLVFALFDNHPRFGGSEASDLSNLMFHHYATQGYFGWSLLEQMGQLAHKPPLYYAGLPLLLSFSPTLSYTAVLSVSALAMGVTLLAVRRLGLRLGGPSAAFAAVLVCASLPGITGRFTMAGAEPILLAFLAWVFVHGLELLDNPRARLRPFLLGATLGLGLLVKWTLAIPLLGVLALVPYLRARSAVPGLLPGLTKASLSGLALFSLWWFPYADWETFVGTAGSEVSSHLELGRHPLLYLPHWFVDQGLGLGAILLVPMALFGRLTLPSSTNHPGSRSRATALLLVGAALATFIVHTLIPHKEARYLLPALLATGVLLGAGLARWIDAERFEDRMLGLGATLLFLLFSAVQPYVSEPPLPEDFIEGDLHLRLLPSDVGISRLVNHPELNRASGSIVAFMLRGERTEEAANFLSWELYARNQHPVISRLPSMTQLDQANAARSLDIASHFIANGGLSPDEELFLRDRGFQRVTTVELPIGSIGRTELWARRPTSGR